MEKLPKMNTSVEAVSVASTFGAPSSLGGTPGKGKGNDPGGSFVVEAISSEDHTVTLPDLPAYWNADNTKFPS